MKEIHILVQKIPAVLYGDSSEKLFLYIHGKMGCKEEAAHFAEMVCVKGYQVLSIDLPGHGEWGTLVPHRGATGCVGCMASRGNGVGEVT